MIFPGASFFNSAIQKRAIPRATSGAAPSGFEGAVFDVTDPRPHSSRRRDRGEISCSERFTSALVRAVGFHSSAAQSP